MKEMFLVEKKILIQAEQISVKYKLKTEFYYQDIVSPLKPNGNMLHLDSLETLFTKELLKEEHTHGTDIIQEPTTKNITEVLLQTSKEAKVIIWVLPEA